MRHIIATFNISREASRASYRPRLNKRQYRQLASLAMPPTPPHHATRAGFLRPSSYHADGRVFRHALPKKYRYAPTTRSTQKHDDDGDNISTIFGQMTAGSQKIGSPILSARQRAGACQAPQACRRPRRQATPIPPRRRMPRDSRKAHYRKPARRGRLLVILALTRLSGASAAITSRMRYRSTVPKARWRPAPAHRRCRRRHATQRRCRRRRIGARPP